MLFLGSWTMDWLRKRREERLEQIKYISRFGLFILLPLSICFRMRMCVRVCVRFTLPSVTPTLARLVIFVY